jgi:hypothetical protein
LGSHETENPIDSGRQTPPPGQWIAGAKALAAFQAAHTGVAKGGLVGGGPRSGSKYATLTDILNVCKHGAEHGLSHDAEPRVLGDNSVVYRMVLNHESGESKFAELLIPFPPEVFTDNYGKEKRMQMGARFQELGGLITYARKYLLQGLYGLYADDGMDPDEDSYDYSKQVAQPSAKPVAKPVTTPKQQSAPPVPSPAQVEKAMNAVVNDGVEVEDPNAPITPEAKEISLRILKSDPKAKAAFLAKFYPSKSDLRSSDVKTMEHAKFLDKHELEARLVH